MLTPYKSGGQGSLSKESMLQARRHVQEGPKEFGIVASRNGMVLAAVSHMRVPDLSLSGLRLEKSKSCGP